MSSAAGVPGGERAIRPDRVIACVGAVVHDERGRLLLVQRAHAPGRGLWSVPGGRVEAGETLAEAVVREVAEETGLTVRAGRVLGSVRVPGDGSGGGGVVYAVTDLVCTLTDPGQTPVAGDDAAAVSFVDAAGLARLPCPPGLVPALRRWGVLPR